MLKDCVMITESPMPTIRSALPSDEAAILALARKFATSFPVQPEGFSKSFAQILAVSHMHLAVAQSGDDIIGYVLGTAHPTFYASGPVAWVEEIMVRDDFRRSGIGKQLMEYFEVWAMAQNCRLVALATRRATDFYQHIGYTESATYFRKLLPSFTS